MNSFKPTLALLCALFFTSITFSQTTVWEEDFTSYPDETIVGTASKWTLTTTSDMNSTNDPVNPLYRNHFWVVGGNLEARDLNSNEQLFETEIIDISSFLNVNISVNISEIGTAENTDYIDLYYVLDGGTETLFATNGQNNAEFTAQTASQTGLNGSTLQIIIKVHNNALTEYHYINDILVQGIQNSSPGAIESGLQLWMRADAGIDPLEAITNEEVTSWADQSANGYIAAKEANGPIYKKNTINFNPTLRFIRGDNTILNLGQAANLDIKVGPNVTDRSDMTIFSALLTDAAGAGSVICKGDNDIRSYQLWLGDTDRVTHYTWGRQSGEGARNWGKIHARNEPKLTTGTINSLGYKSYVNSIEDDMVFNEGIGDGVSTSDVLIGARRNSANTGYGNKLTGNIAEIIVYDRELNSFEIQKVETYLAIKYGITLGYNDENYVATDSPQTTAFPYSGTSDDYIASNGSPLWIGSANAGYGYNVFGIARDDNSTLHQIKSHSSNVQRIENGPDDTTFLDAILTITNEAGALDDDLSYLLVGHNGQDISLHTNSLPVRTDNLVNRIWKSRESNTDTGETTMTFDMTQYLGTIPNPEELHLYIADNASLTGYSNYQGTFNATSDKLIFKGINLGDNSYFTLGTPTPLVGSQDIYFDGAHSHISADRMLGGKDRATIMAWIKPDGGFSSQGVIAGEEALYIYLNNNMVPGVAAVTDSGEFLWRDGLFSDTINTDEWAHISATFNSINGSLQLYLNGNEIGDLDNPTTFTGATLSTTIGTKFSKFCIGKNGAEYGTQYFFGDIDEVRVFDRVYRGERLHQMIFQEIEDNAGVIRGSIIPKDISSTGTDKVNWNRLMAYYPMSMVKGNIVFDESHNTVQAKLIDIGNDIKLQTAPMPFTTSADTDLSLPSTFTNGSVWNIANLTDLDWSILKVSHEVTIDSRMKNLGLFIDSGKKLTVTGDNEINNSWYLELNGTLDLADDSQLVQGMRSDLVTSDTGKILRRQEGNVNKHWYNYWSSPVGSPATTTWSNNNDATDNIGKNTPFSVNMLTDGNGVPLTFSPNWNNMVEGVTSTYWLYTFQNGITYDYWVSIDETSAIQPGFGYTQKGTGNTVDTEQQYIFEGKPNNGTILIDAFDVVGDAGELTESVQDVSLTTTFIGNPYPSALDAIQFIDDNKPGTGSGVISGTIQIWEQWAGSSHYLAEYEGGYGYINNTATEHAYQHADIPLAVEGQGIKTPTNFLSVGQGFFVEVISDTGKIEFNNGQRVFKEENMGESVFFRSSNTETENTAETAVAETQILRLEFGVSSGASRSFVLGFSEDATDGLDYGQDGGMISNPPADDMGSLLNGFQYVIQTFAPITYDKEIDLVLHASGSFTYTLRSTEITNIPTDQDLFLRDNLTGTYYDLRSEQPYNFTSEAGEFAERFDVVFISEENLSNDQFTNDNTLIYVNNIEDMLYVKGLTEQAKQLSMTNMLGQVIKTYNNINNQALENGINISSLSSGVYVVSIQTENNLTIDKKVIIN